MNALNHDSLRTIAPSIFAASPWERMSHRYKMVPTIDVVDALADRGFLPVRAQQSTSRIEGKGAFTKHMIRFRRPEHFDSGNTINVPEVVLVNGHDGSSAYKFMPGIFRKVCMNGLIAWRAEGEQISIRHSGGSDFHEKVIDATYRVLESSEQAIEVASNWSQIELSAPQQMAFATAALELRDNAIIKPVQLLRAKRSEDREDQNGSRDLWRTMNTVQEHLVRGGDRGTGSTGRRATTRPIKSVDADLKTNKALWTLATEMAKIVG